MNPAWTQDKLKQSVVEVNGCWIWQPRTSNGRGYGRTIHEGKQILAHRLSYLLFIGLVPEGFVLHHECSTRKCVNPDHLKLSAKVVHDQLHANNRAQHRGQQLYCQRGHLLAGYNIVLTPHRQCRTCINDNRRAARLRGDNGTKT